MDEVPLSIEKQPNGKYAVRGRPVFQVHRREGHSFDERYMRAAVARQKLLKEKGFLPRVTFGHTSDDITDPGPPVLGFADNYRFDSKSGLLYADYIDLLPEVAEALKDNQIPGVSCEPNLDRPEINVIALLRGKPGWLKLPDARYADQTQRFRYANSEKVLRSFKMSLNKIKSAKANLKSAIQRYAEADLDTKVDPAELQDKEKIRKMIEEILGRWGEEYEAQLDGAKDEDEDDDEDTVSKADEAGPKEDAPDVEPYVNPKGEEAMAMWGRVRDAGGKIDKDGKYDREDMEGNWPTGYKKHADNAKVMRYIEMLRREVQTIKNDKIKSEYVLRYTEALPGSDAKGRAAAVNQVMSQHPSKREELFALLTKRGPSLSPINNGDLLRYADDANDEDRKFEAFYAEKKDNFKGDKIKARREFARLHSR